MGYIVAVKRKCRMSNVESLEQLEEQSAELGEQDYKDRQQILEDNDGRVSDSEVTFEAIGSTIVKIPNVYVLN